VGASIYIVEDHARMRELLSNWIDALPGLSVCGAAGSAETALEELPGLDASLVLVDMSLPQMSGIDLVAALQARFPEMRCLIMSGHNEPGYVERALAAGAHGYVLKGKPSEIEPAIAAVLAGERFISPALRVNAGTGSGH
jgi:DNA-binding NarL/FixJ family response regulator